MSLLRRASVFVSIKNIAGSMRVRLTTGLPQTSPGTSFHNIGDIAACPVYEDVLVAGCPKAGASRAT